MMGVAQLTPATPRLLSVAAAAVPATAVPWPVVSCVWALPVTKFQPGTGLDARSGCDASTPESIMAMGEPVAPLVISQAAVALIFARCHWFGRAGSVGVSAGLAIWSGSTKVNSP